MRVITKFDPWKSELCTCPPKYSFSPYVGCFHGCLYCYVTYIPKFGVVRAKKNLLNGLKKDLTKLPVQSLISMSNSSDPYPPIERKLELTRKSIQILAKSNLRLLVLTKSNIVMRDADILSKMNCAVSLTITTLDDYKASKLEKNAPKPIKRVKALKYLKSHKIPVILRLDPVLPFLTEDDIEEVLEKCKFVDHVVTSTLKLKYDSYKKLVSAFPEIKSFYKEMYFKKGQKIKNSWYLPRSFRKRLLNRVVQTCHELGLSVAFCREGFKFNAKSCDGSHLIN